MDTLPEKKKYFFSGRGTRLLTKKVREFESALRRRLTATSLFENRCDMVQFEASRAIFWPSVAKD